MNVHEDCPKCESNNFPIRQKNTNNGGVFEYLCKLCGWKYSKKIKDEQ